jgi:hypothetical protein
LAGQEHKGRNRWLRETLSRSRKEAAASAVMTGICDNYLGAFAVAQRASLAQMGWLSAAPQLTGAAAQLLSVWLCPLFSRRRAIVTGVVRPMLRRFAGRVPGRCTPGSGRVPAPGLVAGTPRSTDFRRFRHAAPAHPGLVHPALCGAAGPPSPGSAEGGIPHLTLHTGRRRGSRLAHGGAQTQGVGIADGDPQAPGANNHGFLAHGSSTNDIEGTS